VELYIHSPIRLHCVVLRGSTGTTLPFTYGFILRKYCLEHTLLSDVLPIGTGCSFPGVKAAGGVKLTTHLHLAPRLRMRVAISPIPQYVFMAWCLVKHRDNFTFTLLDILIEVWVFSFICLGESRSQKT
jgi:hypothetical protein